MALLLTALVTNTSFAGTQSQTGASPKESLSPQLYNELRGNKAAPVDTTLAEIRNELKVFSGQHATIFQELAAIRQHLTDIDRQLDMTRGELDQGNSVKVDARLVKLEDFVVAQVRSDEALAAADERRTQEYMSWVRASVFAVAGLLFNEAWKRWQDRRRRRAREGVVDTKLNEMSATIGELRDNTNGKMDALLKANGAQEHAAGILEGAHGRKAGQVDNATTNTQTHGS